MKKRNLFILVLTVFFLFAGCNEKTIENKKETVQPPKKVQSAVEATIQTWTTDKGNTYTGKKTDGVIHGEGTCVYASGDRYEGEFVDGVREGDGVYTWESGQRYEGEWVDGDREGEGICVYKNGDRYDGEWVNDEREGHGFYYWTDGKWYEGEWENGKRNGSGVMHYDDGTSRAGTWKDGELVKWTEEKKQDYEKTDQDGEKGTTSRNEEEKDNKDSGTGLQDAFDRLNDQAQNGYDKILGGLQDKTENAEGGSGGGSVVRPPVQTNPNQGGNNEQICPVCHGEKKVKCPSCDGDGTLEFEKAAPNYGGGKTQYYTVKEQCRACKGSGKYPCLKCGGDGKI